MSPKLLYIYVAPNAAANQAGEEAREVGSVEH